MQYKGVSSTKVKISKVALKLFLINGIRGTTTRTIANQAGITEGAIYKHFNRLNSTLKCNTQGKGRRHRDPVW